MSWPGTGLILKQIGEGRMTVSPTGSTEEAIDPEATASGAMPSVPPLLSRLGPGLITGASDDDPSGIATYSQAGAQLGYGLCWTMLYTLPLMAAVQMISARIGRTTGHGIAGVLREHYPNRLLQAVVLLLLAANILNLGADLGAMADALDLILPGPRWLYVVVFAGICITMQVFLRYAQYVSMLKWLTLSLLAYPAVVILANVSWWDLAKALALPRIDFSGGGLTTLVALFGTTISPYLFFWQAAEEAEDLQAYPRRRDLLHAPEQGRGALQRIEFDTVVGMTFSNLVALSIMVTTAAVLHPHGITDIQTSAQAAAALRPWLVRSPRWSSPSASSGPACSLCRCWQGRPPMPSARRGDGRWASIGGPSKRVRSTGWWRSPP